MSNIRIFLLPNICIGIGPQSPISFRPYYNPRETRIIQHPILKGYIQTKTNTARREMQDHLYGIILNLNRTQPTSLINLLCNNRDDF